MMRSVFLFLSLALIHSLSAQSNYVTVASGSWDDPSIWFPAPPPGHPDATDGNITIQSLHHVVIPAGNSVTINETIVNGTLALEASAVLIISDDDSTDLLIATGGRFIRGDLSEVSEHDLTEIIFSDGAVYDHNYTTTAGDLPNATWSHNSILNINGYTTGNIVWSSSSGSKTLGNINYRCENQQGQVDLAGLLTTVHGNFRIHSTGVGNVYISGNNSTALQIKGDLEVNGSSQVIFSTHASWPIAEINIGKDFIFRSTHTAGSFLTDSGFCNVTIERDFLMDAPQGTLTTHGVGGGAAINIKGDFLLQNGKLHAGNVTDENGAVNFIGPVNTVHNFSNNSIITGDMYYHVTSGNVLRVSGESKLMGDDGSALIVDGTLIVESLHSNGAIQTGSGQGNGNIRTAIRTYNAGATIQYNSMAAQFMGDGQPGSSGAGITSPNCVTLIDNHFGVTLNSTVPTVTVGGALEIVNGDFTSVNNILVVQGDVTIGNGNITVDTSNPISLSRTLTINGSLNLLGGKLNMISGMGNGDNAILVLNGNITGTKMITFSGPNCRVTIGGTTPVNLSRDFPVDVPVVLEQLTINRPGLVVVMPQHVTLGNTRNTTSGLTLVNGNLKMNADLIVLVNTALTSGTLYFEDHVVELRRIILSTVQVHPKPSGVLSCNENSTLRITGGYMNTTIQNTLSFSAGGNRLGILELNRTAVNAIMPHISLRSPLTITKSFVLTDGEFYNGSLLALEEGAAITRTANGSFYNDSQSIQGGPYSILYKNGLTPVRKSMEIGIEALGSLKNIKTELSDTLTLSSSLTLQDTLWIKSGMLNPLQYSIQLGTVLNQGHLKAPGESFILTGHFINDGLFDAGVSTVTFSGNTTQSIQGSAVTDFYSIEVWNTANPGVSVKTNQNLTGTLTLHNHVIFDADGESDEAIFTLISQNDAPAQEARIGTLPEGASVMGDVQVQRFMSGEGRIYRYMSSPVADAMVADWMDDFVITGNFKNPSTLTTLCGKKIIQKSPSLFFYDETLPGASGNGYQPYPHKNDFSYNSPLVVGRGYVPFIRECLAAIQVDIRGIINQGSISLPVTYTASAQDSVSSIGWNLVGNPYPSAIDWDLSGDLNENNVTTDRIDGWTRTNIAAAIAIPDNAIGIVRYWDGDVGDVPNGIISSGQAFWVRATNTNPELIIREGVKTNETGEFFRKQSTPALIIHLKKDGVEDKAYVKIRTDAVQELDAWDAPKLDNELFNLATLSADSISLAINAIPQMDCHSIFKLIMTNLDKGTYQLSLTFQGDFPFKRFLMNDNLLNKKITLTDIESYSFDVEDNGASILNRFALAVGREDSIRLTNTAIPFCREKGIVTIMVASKNLNYSAWSAADEKISPVYQGTGSLLPLLIYDSLMPRAASVIVKAFDACGLHAQTKPLPIINEHPDVRSDSMISVCFPGRVQLKAIPTERSAVIKWYDNLMEDPLAEGEVFQTSVSVSSVYYVSAITSSGCESDPKKITVQVVFRDSLLRIHGNVLQACYANTVQWFYEDIQISGAQADSLVMNKPGKYTLKVFKDGCMALANFDFMINDIKYDETNFIVHPNPFNNILFVKRKDFSSIQQVELIDIMGRKKMLRPVNGDKDASWFDTVNVDKGSYILRITTKEDITHVIKVFK